MVPHTTSKHGKQLLVVMPCNRPQTKFAKFVFSQVSICPQGNLGLYRGGSLPRGVSVRGGGGSLSINVYGTYCNYNLQYTDRSVPLVPKEFPFAVTLLRSLHFYTFHYGQNFLEKILITLEVFELR